MILVAGLNVSDIMNREDKDILINIKANDTIEFELPEDESYISTGLQSAVVYFILDLMNNDSDAVEYVDKLLDKKESEYTSEVIH